MSNYLAIATVTAALKNIIQTGIGRDLPGTLVTTVRPDTIATAQKERKVNVYMYQATPNREFNSSNTPSYKLSKGITKGKAVYLDLHYIISFYGDEKELEPQQLLGSTIKALVDQPTLSEEVIEDTLFHAKFLSNSTLSDRIQQIKFAPTMMTADEIVRIWSAMFQSPYTLSIIYQGKAVIIEGEKLGKSPLPIRERQIGLTSTSPIINTLTVDRGNKRVVTQASTLLIRGRQLDSDIVKVKIGEAILTPQKVSNQQIQLSLSALLPQEKPNLRAGAQNLQVIHSGDRDSDRNEQNIESNTIELVLRPNIVKTAVISLTKNWKQQCSAEIEIGVDLLVQPKQEVYLILNEIANKDSEDHVFQAQKRNGLEKSLFFIVNKIKMASYLARIKIDDAESLLAIDPQTQEYSEPVLHIQIKAPHLWIKPQSKELPFESSQNNNGSSLGWSTDFPDSKKKKKNKD